MQEQDFDRELDAMLARYAAVEPRPGLEQRVLANLRFPQVKQGRRWEGWPVRTTAALASAMIAGLLIWVAATGVTRKTELPSPWLERADARPASPRLQAPGDLKPHSEMAESAGHPREPVMASGTHKSRPPKRTVTVSREAEPRLAQFPAPEPLSEQEKLLIQFAEQDPQDAALVAQVTTERLQHEREETDVPDSTVGAEQQR